jgi:hypothetical protein
MNLELYQYISNKISPNIGAGFIIIQIVLCWFISSNLITTEHFKIDDFQLPKKEVNFYLIAGHVFDLNSKFKIKTRYF